MMCFFFPVAKVASPSEQDGRAITPYITLKMTSVPPISSALMTLEVKLRSAPYYDITATMTMPSLTVPAKDKNVTPHPHPQATPQTTPTTHPGTPQTPTISSVPKTPAYSTQPQVTPSTTTTSSNSLSYAKKMGIVVGACTSAVFVLSLITLFMCIAYRIKLSNVNKFDSSRPSSTRENAAEYATIADLMPPNPSTVITVESNLAYTSCKEVGCGASECRSSDGPTSEGNANFVLYDEICDCPAQSCNCQQHRDVSVPCDKIVDKGVHSCSGNEADLSSKSNMTFPTMNMVDNLAYVNARPKLCLLSGATTHGCPNKMERVDYERARDKMINQSMTSPSHMRVHAYNDRNQGRLVTVSHPALPPLNNTCIEGKAQN